VRDPALERWLYAVCALHVAVGVALPLLLRTPLGTGYVATLWHAFGSGAAPDDVAALTRWLVVLLGAMVAGWGVLMAGLVRLAFRERRRAPLDVLLAGLAVWAPLDMAWSASRGVWSHVALDVAALAAIAIPVLLARRRFQ
jgi:hypothetical protein